MSRSLRPDSIAASHLGAAASLVCVVHCAALPLLAIASPGVALLPLGGEWVGWTAIAVAGGTAVVTLPGGRLRHHHPAPLIMAGFGLLGLIAGETLVEGHRGWGVAISATGALALLGAQLIDRRLRRTCTRCSGGDDGQAPRARS